jgi:hypothetical protein
MHEEFTYGIAYCCHPVTEIQKKRRPQIINSVRFYYQCWSFFVLRTFIPSVPLLTYLFIMVKISNMYIFSGTSYKMPVQGTVVNRNVWLWVLRYSNQWVIALQITDTSSRQREPYKTKKESNCQTKKIKIWSTPRRTGQLTVGHNITWTFSGTEQKIFTDIPSPLCLPSPTALPLLSAHSPPPM